jgi:capsular polysaccharide biosynthesis protein
MTTKLRRWLILHVPTQLHPYLRSIQCLATILIGGLLRSLPGTSRSVGPPRHLIATLPQYVAYRNRAQRGAATYTELYPSHTIRRRLPHTLDDQVHPEFLREMSRVSPAAGIAVIEQGRVVTATGSVIGPPDHLISDVSETSLAGSPATHPIFLTPKLPPVTTIDGAVAVLTTYFSHIYYHWIIDLIPRLHLLQLSGLSYDKIVLPMQARFQRESVALLGIDPQRIITAPDLHIEARTLIVPSLPGTIGNAQGWACDFIRRSFLRDVPSGAARRRIFVSRARSGTRRITNEAELLRILEAHGFERVFLEDLPVLAQVRLFNDAQIVVSPHGSGLANLVFCREGTSVIEIFSPHYMNVMYWALSNQLELDYAYLRGVDKRALSAERGRNVHEDISVDVSQAAVLLEEIEERLGRQPTLALT